LGSGFFNGSCGFGCISSLTHREKMGNPMNQRERVKYVFTLRRIAAVTRDATKLMQDFSAFSQAMTP
jgi:hypothetical protein